MCGISNGRKLIKELLKANLFTSKYKIFRDSTADNSVHCHKSDKLWQSLARKQKRVFYPAVVESASPPPAE